MTRAADKLTAVQKRFLRAQLGEAFHAGFRKATDCEQADKVWQLIRQMPDKEYAKVIDFVVWGLGVAQGDKR